MTKKDYVLIAEAVARAIVETELIGCPLSYDQEVRLIHVMDSALGTTNDQYDSGRFVAYVDKEVLRLKTELDMPA